MTREYIKGNPEVSARKKKDHTLKWHKENPEKKRKYIVEWRSSNPGREKEIQLKYNNKNREYRKIAGRKWRKANPVKVKEARIFKKYGITMEDYERMYLNQNGQCAICKMPAKSMFEKDTTRISMLCVDHCHRLGKVRSLLCGKCNKAIGLLREDCQILLNAINYIKYHLE